MEERPTCCYMGLQIDEMEEEAMARIEEGPTCCSMGLQIEEMEEGPTFCSMGLQRRPPCRDAMTASELFVRRRRGR